MSKYIFLASGAKIWCNLDTRIGVSSGIENGRKGKYALEYEILWVLWAYFLRQKFLI